MNGNGSPANVGSNDGLGLVPKREQLGDQMDFDRWCAAHGVYLNDSDDAAKAAKGMARRAWDAAVSAERERCAKVCEEVATWAGRTWRKACLDCAEWVRKEPNAEVTGLGRNRSNDD